MADLTAQFMAGYNSQDATIDNPYLWSSDNWLAYDAGYVFAKRGASTPIKARKSRGYSVRVETAGGNEFVIQYDKYLRAISIDRK
jgi:hypothetical protein